MRFGGYKKLKEDRIWLMMMSAYIKQWTIHDSSSNVISN